MPTEKTEINTKPKAGVADAGHLAVRMVLSAIPVVGGAAKEFFNTVIAPPLVKRQAEWMETMASRLTELEKQVTGFKIDDLSSNENFISTVYYATTINIRSHQEEKVKALENAVLNSAINIQVEEDMQHIFLNFIDELTPTHLRVLKYFENPTQWIQMKGLTLPNYSAGGASTIFNAAFPEISKVPDFAKQIVTDLSSRGLAYDWESMHIMTNRGGMFAPRITEMGRQFLKFIASPLK